jgi:hypothetical protein
MLQAVTVLELYKALSPQEQEKCRHAILAAPVSGASPKPRQKRATLRPEHTTDALVYDLVVRQNGITFKNTNPQAAKFAQPAR